MSEANGPTGMREIREALVEEPAPETESEPAPKATPLELVLRNAERARQRADQLAVHSVLGIGEDEIATTIEGLTDVVRELATLLEWSLRTRASS